MCWRHWWQGELKEDPTWALKDPAGVGGGAHMGNLSWRRRGSAKGGVSTDETEQGKP